MKQILPHLLWLGHAGDGRDFRALFDADIKAVIEVSAEEPPCQPPRELIYCRFPLLDGVGNDTALLSLTITVVADLLRNRVPTLVSCSSGLSRSPAVAAAALALLRQDSPEECLKAVLQHHAADVSPGLWSEIVSYVETTRR
jgi:protein-tyrosine phosphatase